MRGCTWFAAFLPLPTARRASRTDNNFELRALTIIFTSTRTGRAGLRRAKTGGQVHTLMYLNAAGSHSRVKHTQHVPRPKRRKVIKKIYTSKTAETGRSIAAAVSQLKYVSTQISTNNASARLPECAALNACVWVCAPIKTARIKYTYTLSSHLPNCFCSAVQR